MSAGPDHWNPPDLSGQVAVVTGASRGIGRGVAEVLADCGARTYLVGRSATSAPPGRSGTLAEVAEGIASRGGDAVVAPCDLRDDGAVDALFARLREDDGHLEILVNNAVAWEHEAEGGAPAEAGNAPFMYQPPWHAPRWWWDDNFTVGVRSHWLVTNAAAPLFIEGRRGVVFFTSELRPEVPGEQEVVLDLRGTVVERMALLFSLHLRPHLVSSILLYPGFVRTDAIEAAYEQGSDYFKGWTPERYEAKTCSLQFPGRAAATLCADPDLLAKTGQVLTAIDIANAHGFTDTNGVVPTPL
jgi:NAD(P)-dependent dehydrogenase (short-subunit alcohol dehydrogenase family)